MVKILISFLQRGLKTQQPALSGSLQVLDFLTPFSGQMWGSIFIAYIMISLLIYLLARSLDTNPASNTL